MLALARPYASAYPQRMTIRLRVRELREARGWSQAELATSADVRQATISKIETGGISAIHLDTLDRIARALGVDAAVLIEHTRDYRTGG